MSVPSFRNRLKTCLKIGLAILAVVLIAAGIGIKAGSVSVRSALEMTSWLAVAGAIGVLIACALFCAIEAMFRIPD